MHEIYSNHVHLLCSCVFPTDFKVSRKVQVRNCLRKFITFLFSQVGVGALLLCYTILGAVVFIHLESANETARRIFQVNQLRTTTVTRLWNATYCYNVIDTDKWWQEVDHITQAFQTDVVREIQLGYNGADFKDPWSFPKALMYSLRVYTTIGLSLNLILFPLICNYS